MKNNNRIFLCSFFFSKQSAKDDGLNLPTANQLVTPQKTVNTLDNNLPKDLFGVISGIGKHLKHYTKKGRSFLLLLVVIVLLFEYALVWNPNAVSYSVWSRVQSANEICVFYFILFFCLKVKLVFGKNYFFS